MKLTFKELVSYVKGEVSNSEQIRIERLLLTDRESYEIVEKLDLLHQRGELQAMQNEIKIAMQTQETQDTQEMQESKLITFAKPSLNIPFYQKPFFQAISIAAMLLMAVGTYLYFVPKSTNPATNTAKIDSLDKKKDFKNQEFHRLSPPKDSIK